MQGTMLTIQQFYMSGRRLLHPNLENEEKRRAEQCFTDFLDALFGLCTQSNEIESRMADGDEGREKQEKTDKIRKLRVICNQLLRLTPDEQLIRVRYS